jgi:ABC-type transport system substrate-binding protein
MGEADYWTRWQQRRVSRRQIIVAAGGLGLAGLALAGCSTRGRSGSGAASTSQAGAQAKPQFGGTYNIALTTEPTSIDTQIVTGLSDDMIASGGMSRPFRFQTGVWNGPKPDLIDDTEIENDLGVSLESPDAVTWTIKLRTDAKFINVPPVNGHPVEAEDIKASYVRNLTLPLSPSKGFLNMIDPNQIQTPDKQTVVFKLNYPYAPFNKTLASPNYSWIFPREALAGSYDPAKVMIGSGPFILKSHTPNVDYVMTKNPDWFEKGGGPYIDTLHIAVVTDPAQLLAQFTGGHLDEINVTSKDLDTMKRQNPQALVRPVSPTAGKNIYLQLGDPASPFLDDRVRQGMSLALDRDAVHHAIFFDQFVDTHFAPASMGKWSLHLSQLDPDTAQYYKYDVAKARQLLQATGILNQQFKWTYGDTLSPDKDPINGAYLQMLQNAGFKAASVQVDYAKDYVDSGHGIRQGYYKTDTIVYGSQQPFTEIDEFLFSFFHSKSTQNEEMLKDPAVDGMIDKARTLVKEDDRLKATLDLQKYLAKKVYILNAGMPRTFQFIQPRVQGWSRSNTGLDAAVGTYAKLWLTQ